MRLRSISSYLTDFDHPEEIPTQSAPPAAPEAPEPIFAQPSQTLIDEMREELAEKIRAEAKSEFDALLESERELFAKNLAEEKRKWREAEGEKLSARINSRLDGCMAEVGSSVEKVLRPFVAGQVLNAMTDDFIGALRSLAANHDHPMISLKGPRDLLDIVCVKLHEKNIVFEALESEQVDVSVAIGSSLLETRMGEWLERLRERTTPQ